MFAFCQWCIHVNLEEGQTGLQVETAGQLPVLLVRRDKGAKGHAAGVRKQFAHLGYATDILLAVLRAKAQVLVQSRPVSGHILIFVRV